MSKTQYINNVLSYLDRDTHVDAKDNKSYEYALNAIIDDHNQRGFISNEHSNRLCHDYGSEIVGTSYIDDRNSTLVFLKNGELHLLSHKDCSSKFIASDTEFGCDWGFKDCEWVYGEFKTMHPCDDLHVYWSSNCQYYWLNIDEMLDPIRKQSLKDTIKQEKKQCSDRTCDYFRLFKCSATPKLVPIAHQQGGQLSSGAYQFVGRLFDRDKNYTNWFNITDPVYIGSENNQCGERAEGHIEVNVSQLDCRYDGIEIAVIQTSAGITTAKTLTHLYYNSGSTSYYYYGVEGDPIDISELLIKKNTYLQGQDLMQKDGRLFLYNMKQIRNLDYQRRANNITTYWVEYEYTYEEAKRLGIKSHMRGETYAYGIKWNYCDGTHTPVFHIPSKAGGAQAAASRSDNQSSSSDNQSSSLVYVQTQEYKYERTRRPIEEEVNNPQHDLYDQVAENIDSWQTEMSDLCEAMATCEECEKAQEACDNERAKVEELGGKWLDVLAQYGASQGKDQYITNLTPQKIKEGARELIEAVKNRERIKYQAAEYTVNNQTTYESSGPGDGLEDIFKFGSQYYDANGTNITDASAKIISSGQTILDIEQDIYYPDFKNCQGDFLYGDLAGLNVRHHKFPNTQTKPHYVSKAVGVPNPVTPDVDPLSDSYVRIMGVAFSDIEFPLDEELSKPLDENNPYTILYVKRTDANKKVLAKGLGVKTFYAENNGKQYQFARHAINSKETVDRNISQASGTGKTRAVFDGNAASESFIFHSLDTNVRQFALNFDQVFPELEIYGEGWRYGFYDEGRAPDDTFYGSRIDQRGTRQFINVNKYTSTNRNAIVPGFKTYARAHSVISPPKGGNIPLMNKYRESSVWIDGELPALTRGIGSNSDNSFIGDVFDHSVPIEQAAGHYVSLFRDLPNQYGDLTGLVYVPILQANKLTRNAIQGPVGDVYIGPYFVRRTSFISEKVGNKFDIPTGQARVGYEVTKQEHRSVCDPPDDIIHAHLGTWVHTTLPKEKDAADAKNYAGLHSPGEAIQPRAASIAATGPETDYYYPKVLKTLVVFWGEFEVNPHYRAVGDRLNGQVVYPNIKPFELDSSIPHPWEDSYLNRFYCKVEQPSKWAIVKKALVRTILTAIFPILGIDNLFDIASGSDLVANLVEFPALFAIWYLLTQQIFTNDYLDKMLGIPECKTDNEGEDCNCTIEQFEDNYHGYCWDFSKLNDTQVYYAMPEPYNTCVCDNCDDFTNNEIYYSNKQIITSELDAYKNFHSNQYLAIPADAGKLKKLVVIGNQFVAHTTDNMYLLQYGNPTLETSVGEILMGQAGLLVEPRPMFENIMEGFLGINDSNHSINTQWGYFFIAEEDKKVYRYGGQLEEISMNHMRNFFKEHLGFCNPTECKHEKVIGESYYSLGIDPRLNRMLLTRSDKNGSYTISYDLDRKKWISFHSYIPQSYIWDRDHMYTSDGTSMWIHDEKNNFQSFYGKYNPHIIELSGRLPETDILAFEYKSTILNTECREAQNLNLYKKETFDKVWIRNSHQTTGIIEFIKKDKENLLEANKEYSGKCDIEWKNSQWRFNKLYDFTQDSDNPIVEYPTECFIDITPVNVSYDPALCKNTYNNRILIDNYITYRFIFDRHTDKKLYTKSILTQAQKVAE